MVDLAKAVLREAKLSAKFEIMPMARASHELKTNPNTIMLSFLKIPARQKQFKWLGAIYFTDAYLVSLKDHKDNISHLNHAKLYKVATIRGYTSAKYLKDMGFEEDKNLILVSYYQQLWQMLYKKRIDFVVMNTLTLNNELKMSGLDPSLIAKRVHLTDFPSTLYFATNNQFDEQAAIAISKGLQTLKVNGKYQAILKKWQLPLPPTIN